MYDFIVNVLDTRKLYYAFNALELKRMLLANHSAIQILDHWAGSHKKEGMPTIVSIAKK